MYRNLERHPSSVRYMHNRPEPKCGIQANRIRPNKKNDRQQNDDEKNPHKPNPEIMKTEKSIADAMQQAGKIIIEAFRKADYEDEILESHFSMKNGKIYTLKFKREKHKR